MPKQRAEGFMRPPKGMTPQQQYEAERFAAATGIGPLFDVRPLHHGQHSWCCETCNGWRKTSAKKVRQIRQPWQSPDSLAA